MIRIVRTLLLGVVVLMLTPASVCLARPQPLDAVWRFMLDPIGSERQRRKIMKAWGTAPGRYKKVSKALSEIQK